MGRLKNDGKGRLGGRCKGTPNKATTDIKTWISDILESGRDRFKDNLELLEPSEYIRVFTGLLNYIIPKQSPTSVEHAIRREKEMLQELLLSMPDEMVNRVSDRLYNLSEQEHEDKIK